MPIRMCTYSACKYVTLKCATNMTSKPAILYIYLLFAFRCQFSIGMKFYFKRLFQYMQVYFNFFHFRNIPALGMTLGRNQKSQCPFRSILHIKNQVYCKSRNYRSITISVSYVCYKSGWKKLCCCFIQHPQIEITRSFQVSFRIDKNFNSTLNWQGKAKSS